MSKLSIVATEFNSYVTGEKTFGFRIYDDYFCAYDNMMEGKCEDDLELLAYVIQQHLLSCGDEEIKDALNYLQESQNGISINNQWYDWAEIKNCF